MESLEPEHECAEMLPGKGLFHPLRHQCWGSGSQRECSHSGLTVKDDRSDLLKSAGANPEVFKDLHDIAVDLHPSVRRHRSPCADDGHQDDGVAA
jgi:hypothetical protein